MTRPPTVAISFVCMGNICRSPTAEAVMRHLVAQAGLTQQILLDSAGTGSWHVGQTRDRRATAVGVQRGIPLAGVARQFSANDFQRFDLILAMDRDNLLELKNLAPDEASASKVALLRSFEEGATPNAQVPDPYYGGPEGFEEVFDICLAACQGLLKHLQKQYGLNS